MKRVRKAIITVSDLGTRFLPATKAMPKEMLPIIDKPTIQYIVEEAIDSGIEDIIIVIGKRKRAIEDQLDNSFELEQLLEVKGNLDVLADVRKAAQINIHYIRQKEPKGLGHAIWCARKLIGDEPFALLLGEDIIQAETPGIKQLMQLFEEIRTSVIGVEKVDQQQTHRYSIINPLSQEGRAYEVQQFIEKPIPGTASSNLAIIGRYILTPEIFEFLDKQETDACEEIHLTDAIQHLHKLQTVYAYDLEGTRYDVGEKLGFIQTTIEMALQDEDLRDELLEYMDRLMTSRLVV